MARYDRIARLPLPEREATFEAWPAVADLAARERDTELGRRARLRFLALRPVLRLLRQGWYEVPRESLIAQVRTVREELGQLGARDPERRRLGALLTAVEARRPAETAVAAAALGRIAADAGHTFAAEEFHRAAFRTAVSGGLHDLALDALLALGALAFAEGRRGEARAWYRKAVEYASETGPRHDRATAVTGFARVLRADGDVDAARAVLTAVLEGLEEGHDGAAGTVAAGLCAVELEAGFLETALERGWMAVSRLDAADGARRDALRRMGAAFRALAMTEAAERCEALAGSGDAPVGADVATASGTAAPGPSARAIAARVAQLPLPPGSD